MVNLLVILLSEFPALAQGLFVPQLRRVSAVLRSFSVPHRTQVCGAWVRSPKLGRSAPRLRGTWYPTYIQPLTGVIMFSGMELRGDMKCR